MSSTAAEALYPPVSFRDWKLRQISDEVARLRMMLDRIGVDGDDDTGARRDAIHKRLTQLEAEYVEYDEI